MGLMQSDQGLQLQVHTPTRLLQDQQVSLEVQGMGSRWLWLALGAYGLPLLGFLTGALVSYQSGAGEMIVAAVAFFSMASGLFLWRHTCDWLLSSLEIGLCMQSARIVTIDKVTCPQALGETE